MLAAAWGTRRVEGKWVPVVCVLLIVSFANNIAFLGDGSAFGSRGFTQGMGTEWLDRVLLNEF